MKPNLEKKTLKILLNFMLEDLAIDATQAKMIMF